jgi:hypothetical protein
MTADFFCFFAPKTARNGGFLGTMGSFEAGLLHMGGLGVVGASAQARPARPRPLNPQTISDL